MLHAACSWSLKRQATFLTLILAQIQQEHVDFVFKQILPLERTNVDHSALRLVHLRWNMDFCCKLQTCKFWKSSGRFKVFNLCSSSSTSVMYNSSYALNSLTLNRLRSNDLRICKFIISLGVLNHHIIFTEEVDFVGASGSEPQRFSVISTSTMLRIVPLRIF